MIVITTILMTIGFVAAMLIVGLLLFERYSGADVLPD
jgi:hypothetical protein